MWLEGHVFDKFRRVADGLFFYLDVKGSADYPVINWERAGGYNVLRAGEPPAALAVKPITVTGTSFSDGESQRRLRMV